MKLKTYIKKLQKLEEKHGNLELVYSIDDEGNSFHSVSFEPSIILLDEFNESVENELYEHAKKYVCIN